ncbi:DJ-1/PfpI family protein [Bradyrhizobium betae]|uniref:DJ-1/PfpI family protein n=1 Tax=Bradyrhizobium betae TaxID=244734 RepID=UPI003D66BE65
MKIGIPVYEGVDMLDVAGPFEMFDWAEFDVELVAAEPGLKRFRGGFRFEVTKSFAECDQYDAVWVPGGDPPRLPGSSTILTGPTSIFCPGRPPARSICARSAKERCCWRRQVFSTATLRRRTGPSSGAFRRSRRR